MAELTGLVTAPQYDQASGQCLYVEYALRGLETSLPQPWDVRDERPDADRQHDLRGLDLLLTHLQRVRTDETGGGVVEVQAAVRRHALLHPMPVPQDQVPHPFPNEVVVDRFDLSVDADLARVLDMPDHLGRIDQDLARDASPVQTRTAHDPVLHQGDLQTSVPCLGYHVRTGSGPDHDKLVFLHQTGHLLHL